jgi:hypothetical protein
MAAILPSMVCGEYLGGGGEHFGAGTDFRSGRHLSRGARRSGKSRRGGIIYVGASVDKSSLMLLSQKGITSFEQFRGKTISTTSPGAFGEIVVRMTARKNGMEVGKDVKLIYHRTPGRGFVDIFSRQCRRHW